MAVINATKTVVGVFDRMGDAQNAVRELESAGFLRDDISVIANKNATGYDTGSQTDADTTADTGKGASVATDAGIGAALGGVGGLLLSFAGLAVPGIGPVLAVGPIVAALSGAGIGAVAGGIIGALTESGIPEEEARYYAEGVRRGHVLVTVRTDEGNAVRAQDTMDRFGAIDVEGRVSGWRDRGWAGHNPGAEPLSADELRREHEYRAASDRQADAWASHPVQDIGRSLPRAEARNAAIDKESTLEAPTPMEDASRDTGLMVGDLVHPLQNDIDNPSNYSDAVENNVRRPDPAVVRAERGFERAMESTVQSARRLGSRVYNRTDR